MANLPAMVLSGIRLPIAALDSENRFIFANPAAEEFFQASAGTLLGSVATDLLDDSVSALLDRARQGGAPVNGRGVDIASERLGQRRVDIQISPLHDTAPGGVAGATEGALVLVVHEQRLAERLRGQHRFEGAARSTALVSALLAHEIKNPLAGIRGAAELIASGDGEDREALTRLVMAEADRIASLLTRVETLVGDNPPAMEPVNIHEVLDHCIQLAENSFGRECRFTTSFDPSLPPALGDRDLLVQCFVNLIKNACEAVEAEETITIQSSYDLGSRLATGESRAACPLVVEITDHGEGIPETVREHIFDPFITGRPNGTGLGLALVASTISGHGGTIDIETRPGLTSFRVGLPVAERAA